MPTGLPPNRPHQPRGRWSTVLNFALVVSVLLLGALVQITEQIHLATPHYALTAIAATLETGR